MGKTHIHFKLRWVYFGRLLLHLRGTPELILRPILLISMDFCLPQTEQGKQDDGPNRSRGWNEPPDKETKTLGREIFIAHL